MGEEPVELDYERDPIPCPPDPDERGEIVEVEEFLLELLTHWRVFRVRAFDPDFDSVELADFARVLSGKMLELQTAPQSFEVKMLKFRLHDLRNLTAFIFSVIELRSIGRKNETFEAKLPEFFAQGEAILSEQDFDSEFFRSVSKWREIASSLELTVDMGTIPPRFDKRKPCVQVGALYRIVSNVFSNAKIHGGATCLELTFEDVGPDRVKILINDNGRGFQGHDPFNVSEARRSEGHGIGMSASRDMLCAVGGNLYPLNLDAHNGATWVLELPFKAS